VNEVPSAVVNLDVKVPVTITQQPMSVRTNPGKSVVLTVGASGTAPITYQWYKDSVLIQSGPSPSYSIASVGSNDEGTYRVELSNLNGTSTAKSNAVVVETTDGLTINQQPVSPLPVVLQNAVTQPVTFSVVATSTKPILYQWYKGTEAIKDADAATYTIGNVTSASKGTYYVVVSSGSTKVTSSLATLEVYDPIQLRCNSSAWIPRGGHDWKPKIAGECRRRRIAALRVVERIKYCRDHCSTGCCRDGKPCELHGHCAERVWGNDNRQSG